MSFGVDWDAIARYFKEHPDVTIGELSERFNVSKVALVLHFSPKANG